MYAIALELVHRTTTPSGTTNTSYIYGDLLFGGTAPVEQITTNGSGATAAFIVANQTGVQGVYGSAGTSLEQALYSTYGKQTIVLGSDVTPFSFQGSYTDSTGLIYLINRYYDPTTDQFLSIDPYVAATDQPYAFTNDDPLNAEDPNGLIPSGGGTESNAQAAAVARAYALAQARAAAERQAEAQLLARKILQVLSNNDIPRAGTAADLTRAALKEATTHDNPLTPSAVVSDIDIAAGYASAATTAIGGVVQSYNDVQSGDSMAYAVGDGVSTAGGTRGGAVAGSLICGGPEDGVGILCGILGGLIGGSVTHDTYRATVR